MLQVVLTMVQLQPVLPVLLCTGTVLSREEFYAKAEALDELQRLGKKGGGPRLFVSAVPPSLPSSSALVRQIHAREQLIRCGSLSTIIFIRHKNSKGIEVSGYIDLADRLKAPDYSEILAERKK